MGSLSTISILFAGCSGLAALTWFITSKIGSKSSIMEAVHKVTQKIGKENIGKIEEKQNKVRLEIKIKENISEDVKVKINKIQENAANEINDILKENNISRVHTVIDSEWENL